MSAELNHQMDDALSDGLQHLVDLGFEGEIVSDLANRLVGSTDNSIYRLVPSAILFPKTQVDLQLAVQWAHDYQIGLTARGGGTGTNGQSLTESVVLDVSRHLNKILSFDEANETVIVQPGVVLDQLNDYLAPFGYFFPPTVSTSSRATLGGMFGTDASGKGSRIYGRMSDYVRRAHIVLEDGSSHWLGEAQQLVGHMADIAKGISDDLRAHEEHIREIFPQMNRGLTGYNLLDALPGDDGQPDLIKLLAGSEGTLAFTSELHLKVIRKPSHRALTVIAYEDCEAALDHVPDLIATDPAAIEFLDDKIVDLAAQSLFWSEVEAILGPLQAGRGFLFVEFVGQNTAQVAERQEVLSGLLASNNGGNLGVIATEDATQINALWDMRKRAVGLLGASKGRRVGIPFVEDAAVPPEKLAAFVKAFRGELDGAGLSYGMFGHADVGCVHVRPMLDMRSHSDRQQIRAISDKVSNLAKRYDGLIWGEHGKGVRGEYLLSYVGPELFALMRRIKAAFDPLGRLNEGKLAIPAGKSGAVIRLDRVPFRGARDQEIDAQKFQAFEKSVACNGNGACYNWSPSDPMCPSYKATRDRAQGPKGRATLFREWTHALSTNAKADETAQIEQALHESLKSCLSCHSCSNSCPVRVDIPDMKAHFLARYFQTHRRPLRDHLVRHMEQIGLILRKIPTFANALMNTKLSRLVLERVFAIVDAPAYATDRVEDILARHEVACLSSFSDSLRDTDWDKSVCLVLDSFTGSYETEILDASISLFKSLGLTVYATSIQRNGKALHVRGFLDAFDRQRDQTIEHLNEVASLQMLLVGLEPSVLELFRREYHQSSQPVRYEVKSLDQFLIQQIGRLEQFVSGTNSQSYKLFLHCTEKTADPATASRWQTIFAALGQALEVEKTGCCGMAGLFGHEKEHQSLSRQLFDMSWRKPIQAALQEPATTPIATGFSCRSQTKRLTGQRPQHPIEILRDIATRSVTNQQ